MNLAQTILVLILRVYRVVFSPVLAVLTVPLGMGCRFTPTCSQYALEAIQQHGALRGGLLAIRRLLRCQPWGSCGHDPVPPAPCRFAPDSGLSVHPGEIPSTPTSIQSPIPPFKTCEHGS